MAVEVAQPRRAKRLHRHVVPVVMIALALLVLPAIVSNGYKGNGPHSATILSRGLVTQVLHVRPTADGLAQVTFGSPPTGTNTNPALQLGLAQIGQSVQLSLSLQASPGNQ
jgi:hypothetical protein